MAHVTAESVTIAMLPQLHCTYSSILKMGQDIGQVFVSDSCWPHAPLKCVALAPSAELHPHRGTAGPGFSWHLWRPLWSTGPPAPTRTAAAAPRTGSLHAHTPLLSLQLGEERERKSSAKEQLKVKRHVSTWINKSHQAECHSNRIVKYNMHFM